MTPSDSGCIGLFSTKYVLWEGSMKNACVKLFLLFVSFLFIGTFLAFAESPKEGGAVIAAEYAGSSSCKRCHVAGGTASVLSDAELVRAATYYHARK